MKSILIIDTPSKCYECPCYRCDDMIEAFCLGFEEPRQKESNSMPSWCPLRSLPKKKDAFEECMKFDMMTGKVSEAIVWQVQGYNACIDDILGKDENED